MGYCVQCGAVIDDFFCVMCGTKVENALSLEPDADEQSVITYYFNKRYPYKAIVVLLANQHGISMCKRTLKRRLKSYGLSKRRRNITDNQLIEVIQRELEGPSSSRGYRGMWDILKTSYGIFVPRDDVMEHLRVLDPDGTAQRKARRLRRRKYVSEGPNKCWHVDGYDKLKPYGLPIHGCIDGYSRKIIWLKVARSNNNPLIPAAYYIEAINTLKVTPTKIRTDCGTENGIMAATHCYLNMDDDAHSYGSSHHNQRIEAWWSQYKKSFSTWVISFFQDLIERNLLALGHVMHLELAWFVFSDLLQSELDAVKEQWNSHYIRRSRHDTVPGIPDVLYFAPELSGGVNMKKDLPESRLNDLLQERDIINEAEPFIDEHDEEMTAFFKYVVDYYRFIHPPSNWADAKVMYESIVQLLH